MWGLSNLSSRDLIAGSMQRQIHYGYPLREQASGQARYDVFCPADKASAWRRTILTRKCAVFRKRCWDKLSMLNPFA